MSISSFDESSCEDYSDAEQRPRLDEIGRPLTRPTYQPIGQSSVLSRVKEFLPIFRDAALVPSEPQILYEKDSDIILPKTEDQTYDDDFSSQSSYGVEVDVGLGVYDIHGAVDESALALTGTPTIYMDSVEDANLTVAGPIIEEIQPISTVNEEGELA
jgi:hypothetical protein